KASAGTGYRRSRFAPLRELKRFAAPACLSSPGRTDFRVTSTARPPGFALLGCPRRRRGNTRESQTRLQARNCRTLRTSAGGRIRIVRKDRRSVRVAAHGVAGEQRADRYEAA